MLSNSASSEAPAPSADPHAEAPAAAAASSGQASAAAAQPTARVTAPGASLRWGGFADVRLPAVADLLRDGPAGAIAALVILAYSLSASALLFQGKVAGGIPLALWSLLVGATIIGLWTGLTTSLPPLALAMDTPAMAVFVVLAVNVADEVAAKGGSPDMAVVHVLLALWFASQISSVILLLLGALKAGKAFRFIPYCVVGGFLSATGFLLMVSGISLALGHRLSFADFGRQLPFADATHVGVAAAFGAALVLLRIRIRSALLVPAMFSASCLVGVLVLRFVPFPGSDRGWFLQGIDRMEAWSVLGMARRAEVDWPLLLGHLPQALAISAVIIISNVVKLSGLEVGRSTSADLDHELWTNGASNIAGSLAAGFATSYIVSISRLLDETGARSRWAGVIAAMIVGVVLVTKVNLPAVAPIPILAGLLVFLGYGLMTDSVRRPYKQRAWFDLILAVGIAVVCVRFGYITGILAGFVLSCLLFAWSYSRVGAIRRHLTRASFASDVERGRAASEVLGRRGDAIHIYWLSGYLFFGSSDRLVLSVRRTREAGAAMRYALFDCSGVSGIDASAIMSLLKLKNYCLTEGLTLVFSGLTAQMRTVLDRDGYFATQGHILAFPSRSEALAWCEEQVLAEARQEGRLGDESIEAWLAQGIGLAPEATAEPGRLLGYLERKEVGPDDGNLYRQGEPAETIDLIASGSVTIVFEDAAGTSHRVRQMATRTVVGEMGFFRSGIRTASVIAEGEATILTLTRASFERMKRDEPGLANLFLLFIIRTLAGRVEFANKEITALL